VLSIIDQTGGLLSDLISAAQKGIPIKEERLKTIADKIATQTERGTRIVKRLNQFAHSVNEPSKRVDLEMPGMNGIETLSQILSDSPDQQVIFLTGFASVPKSVEAMKKGAVEFLEKPANIEQLVGMVRQAQFKKSELFQKRMEESVDKIAKKRGW
jgi:FixJ family two-component response regulator